MKIRKSRSKSPLFLMELTIVILFFSLSAAICMKVFSVAKVRTDFARDVSNAGFAAESIAECLKADAADGIPFESRYPYAVEENGGMTVYFASDWTHCKAEDGVYRAVITTVPAKYIVHAIITVSDDRYSELFKLECAASGEGVNG